MSQRDELRLRKEEEMAAIQTTCQRMIADGASREELLAFLHHARSTTSGPWPNVIEAIKYVRETYGLPLPEAVGVVQADPTWSEEARGVAS